jgi:hypothetical protein
MQLVIEQRLFHVKQQPAEVIAPTEGARFWGNTFNAHDREPPWVSLKVHRHRSCKQLLHFIAQGGFAHSGWPQNQNQ